MLLALGLGRSPRIGNTGGHLDELVGVVECCRKETNLWLQIDSPISKLFEWGAGWTSAFIKSDHRPRLLTYPVLCQLRSCDLMIWNFHAIQQPTPNPPCYSICSIRSAEFRPSCCILRWAPRPCSAPAEAHVLERVLWPSKSIGSRTIIVGQFVHESASDQALTAKKWSDWIAREQMHHRSS